MTGESRMKYTPQDQELMSRFMRGLLKTDTSEENCARVVVLSWSLSCMFAESDPKFDKDRFLKDCGLT